MYLSGLLKLTNLAVEAMKQPGLLLIFDQGKIWIHIDVTVPINKVR